jgi:hypothetical protein
MVTAYYDESGEYQDNQLVNMSIGGCVSPCERWKGFGEAWSAVLAADGLTCFHMTDFEAWRAPFDFKLPSGERDNERHKRLLNALLDLMADHIEWFMGFTAGSQIQDQARAHFLAMESCVIAAVTHAVHDLWDQYQEPINLVFAKQRHFSMTKIAAAVELYNWGDGMGRIGSLVFDEPQKLPQLQAADILAFEMSKVQRPERVERYPFISLREMAKERGLTMRLKWGPVLRSVDFGGRSE